MRILIIVIFALISNIIYSQVIDCNAKFEVNASSQNDNALLQFTDESSFDSLENTNWYWYFENGIPQYSTDRNPVVVFQDTGFFRVCLTITERNCTSTSCDTIEVKNHKDTCFAEFDYFCDGSNVVNFFNQSSEISGTTHWAFGDGYLSNDNNPVHVYAEPGLYDVCLFIESASCFDSVCHTIFVGEPTGCQSFFNVNPGFWPNTYVFQNLSFGDLESVYWDFGDGEFSTDTGGLSHTFTNEGVYQVCLNIITTDGCESSYCKSVVVENTLGTDCYANFEIAEEYCTNCFSFVNYSDITAVSFLWDFGDGESVFGPTNPIHTYSDSGWYEICLTVYTSDNCIATFCDSLYVYQSLPTTNMTVSGHVYAGSTFLPQGMAILFRKMESAGFEAIKKCEINNGLYYFDVDTSGNYLIYAVPFFDADYYFPVYFPTYYGNELFWSEATMIFVNEPALNYLDIHLNQSNTLIYGKAETTGILEIGEDANFEDDIFSINWFESDNSSKTDSLLPAQNITVLLLDTNYMPFRFALTDFDGLYSFSKLSNCNYIVYPEKAGLITHPANLTLNEETNSESFSKFLIGTNDIFYLSTDIQVTKSRTFKYYPNPVTDFINVEFENINDSKVDVSIINLQGVKVFSESVLVDDFQTRIPVEKLQSGYYLLYLRTDQGISFVGSFVK